MVMSIYPAVKTEVPTHTYRHTHTIQINKWKLNLFEAILLSPFFNINLKWHVSLLYIKQISSKDLLFSTGNYTQCYKIVYKGKESEKEHTHMYN